MNTMKAVAASSIALLLALAFAAVPGAASAQTYPTRTIKVINPWGAGGAADSIIRPVMQKLSEVVGQSIVIENQPGASGMIGAASVAKAPPDGYTLLFANLGPTAISPALESKMAYDSVKDFVAITQMVTSPQVLVARNDLPVRNLQEFIAYAKASPTKLTYASVGVGSTTHLGAEMLAQMAGVDFVHVPYKGSAQVTTDLLGGQIDFAFINIAGVVPLMNPPRVRPLAVSTARRSGALPDLPSVAETYPGYDLNSWWGLMAPAGTPSAIVDRLYRETAKIMRSPDIEKRMRDNGLDVDATSPEQFAAQIRMDLERWPGIVKARGIKTN
jgi:tripartite-type tricarboxylate transporter receptor subunit TctC